MLKWGRPGRWDLDPGDKMRILFLGNNELALRILRWLREQREDIAALVVHPPEKGRFRDDLIEASGLPPERIYEGQRLREADVLAALRRERADLALSVLFGYVLRREFLELFPGRCFNLHPALLPYNQGAHPNVWSLVESTPAGVTLHQMDEGLDTGDVVAQQEVAVEPVDTAESLYGKLMAASFELFVRTWPQLRTGSPPRRPQDPRKASSHRVEDLAKTDEIELDRSYKARDLLNLLRARTFPPYPSAFFRVGGKKVYVRVDLSYGPEGKEDR